MTRSETVRNVIEEFDLRRAADEREYDARLAELSEKIPGFGDITHALSSVGLRILDAAMKGGDTAAAVAEVRRETEKLRGERCDLLEKAGYPRDFADRRYRCEKCSDSGYEGLKMCTCLRKEIILAGLKNSGLGRLADTQSFDTFSEEYYSGKDLLTVRRNASVLRSFAENFSKDTTDNFLLIGPTGLGKTHLSTSVAVVVIERGFDVLYRTAQEIMSVFEKQRFGSGTQGDGTESAFYDSDLLIIDDLGAEPKGEFAAAAFTDIVDSRLLAKKNTIISTNLTASELVRGYSQRFASRVLSCYTLLTFIGRDVRMLKMTGEK